MHATSSGPITFKPRRRRVSPARLAVLERMAPTILADHGDVLVLADVVEPADQVVLDIGFGGGQELIDVALARPEEAVIGVEVHTPGIARVLAAIEARQLTNVRVVQGDAVRFLDRLPPASLAGIRVFFPDPWPKVRQRDKRLVQAPVVARLTDLLRPGGTLHLATDVADYAAQMEAVCAAEHRLEGGRVDRPAWRPVTRFERRGIEEGRHAVDLVYRSRG